jgi:hypothetical protein
MTPDWFINSYDSTIHIFDPSLDSPTQVGLMKKKNRNHLMEKRKALGLLDMREMTIFIARYFGSHFYLIQITIESKCRIDVYDSLNPDRKLDQPPLDQLTR